MDKDSKDAAYLRDVASLLEDDRNPAAFTSRRAEIRDRLREIAARLDRRRSRH